MNTLTTPQRIVIMGAAGRDFHNFNQVYRNNPQFKVIAFTAAQISGIANRYYPPCLAGDLYPDGISIVEQEQLETLCHTEKVDTVVFSYSDVKHTEVMHLASRVLASGANFQLLGTNKTYLTSKIPVIAVSAVRTGCGKSQTTRWLSRLLQQKGLKVAAIRHPMPYGDLERQIVQRFATMEDLTAADCTIEEREEYEPHIAMGNIIYAGVDYGLIVEKAESEADILLWDGGNNDFPFIKPDLHLVLTDPLRPGDESNYHPGETVLRMADIVIIPKSDVAKAEDITKVSDNVRKINPHAQIIQTASPITLDDPDAVRDRRVLVIEDGPTTTHGGMGYGAGYVAAMAAKVAEIIDPRPFAVPDIAKVYQAYPHLSKILPAMGYFPAQLQALQDTINQSDADMVISATPSDLSALIEVNKPIIRARYELAEIGKPELTEAIQQFLERRLP